MTPAPKPLDLSTLEGLELDGISGVIGAYHDGALVAWWTGGYAHREFEVPNTLDTVFGVASVAKTFTAVAILSLVAEGRLGLDTTARSVLGADLPLIAEDVTIEHLLSHRSGIGDYLDEEEDMYAPMPVPVQELDRAEAYLRVLDGFETVFPAGESWAYCNGGFVVLGIIAERVSGVPYGELVAQRVFGPAGMTSSAFARSDRPLPRTAVGYKPDGSSNIFHVPVVGVGDGGAYTTAADLHAFWSSLHAGRILPLELVEAMTSPITPDVSVYDDDDEDEEDAGPGENPTGYGYGVWLKAGTVAADGGDHGITAFSRHDPRHDVTVTLLSNEEDVDVYGPVFTVQDAVIAAL